MLATEFAEATALAIASEHASTEKMMSSLPIVRTSERRDFLQCEQKWWWSWRMGLKPLGDPPIALWFGSLVHDALAAWYLPGTKRGPHPAETFAKLAGDEIMMMKIESSIGNGMSMLTEESLVDANALGISMLEGYVRTWGRDERWRVLQPEKTFQLHVPHPTKKGRFIGIFAGTYDLVYEDMMTGDVWLEEHKTARAILTGHLPLDPQAGGYWTAATNDLIASGLMKKGQRLKGIEYNFLRKGKPDERPRNADGHYTNKPLKSHYVAALEQFIPGGKMPDGTPWEKATIPQLETAAKFGGLTVLGEVSKHQPRPLFERERVFRSANERKRQIERLQDEIFRMRPIRDGELRPLKNPGRDCGWCTHFHLCMLDEQGKDADTYIEAAYIVQDPYADHRKTTEGED